MLAWAQANAGLIVAGIVIVSIIFPKLIPQSIKDKLPAWLGGGAGDALEKALGGIAIVKDAKAGIGEVKNVGGYLRMRLFRARIAKIVSAEDVPAATEHVDALLVMIAKAQAVKEQPKSVEA